MQDELSGCGCGATDCWTMPPEFFRVRYFFGQRLGVMELTDEATYHAGKHAFHNARAHGGGVLCGLRAERFPFTAGADTTILRVHRGAALDGCGREIVVAADQCIDVAAWFAKHKDRPELAEWTAGTTQHLTVAVRYRECPTDPSPAPRDPCGCDNGGCEFGRVREGFELQLFTTAEAEKLCKPEAFPRTAQLLHAVHHAGPEGSAGDARHDLVHAIHHLVAHDCPAPPESPWLCLARFAITLDATPVPVDIGKPNNAIRARRSLLSTSALQALTVDLARAATDAELLGAGPRAGALHFVSSGPSTGTLVLPIRLAEAGSPPLPAPIVEATVASLKASLKRLDPSAGWVDVALGPVTYTTSPEPQIRIDVTGTLSSGSRFRLTLESPADAPVADALGRPLSPQRLARLLAFVPDGASLKLDPAV